MTIQNSFQLQVGDWVKAKAKSGELLHGFVEAIEPVLGTTKMYVVASDLEESVGTSIELRTSGVQRYPEATAIEAEEQLLDALDLALLTRDKAWFYELSAQLKQTRQRAAGHEPKRNPASRTRNRLRPSDMPS